MVEFNYYQSKKKQDENWISCQHPARHIWEQEGTEILGMRHVSDSKVFLLVLMQAEGLLRNIDLSDGTIEPAIKDALTKEVCIQNRDWVLVCRESKILTWVPLA